MCAGGQEYVTQTGETVSVLNSVRSVAACAYPPCAYNRRKRVQQSKTSACDGSRGVFFLISLQNELSACLAEEIFSIAFRMDARATTDGL